MAQRVHVICHSDPGLSKEDTYGLTELNKLLEDGWTIMKTEQMAPGNAGAGSHASYALCFLLSKANP